MWKWGNVKQKPFWEIQAHSCVFRHNQVYSRTIQGYFEPCELWHIQNPCIFKARDILFGPLVYLKLWYIQNQRHIQKTGYSELWDIQNQRHTQDFVEHLKMNCFKKQLTAIIIFESHNQCHNISFSCLLVYEINIIILLQVLVLLQKSLFNVKKYGGWGRGAEDREF